MALPPATGHQYAELGREVQGPLIQAPAAALRDPPPTIPPCPSRGGRWPRPRNSKVAALTPAGLAGVGGVRTTRAGKDRSSSGRGTCRAPRTGVRRRPGGAIAPVPGARRSSPARPDPREARDTTGPPVKAQRARIRGHCLLAAPVLRLPTRPGPGTKLSRVSSELRVLGWVGREDLKPPLPKKSRRKKRGRD